jgi:anion-transporting  ArsA/GET3 family ATPase
MNRLFENRRGQGANDDLYNRTLGGSHAAPDGFRVGAQLIVVVGAGGVGKTTTAASLALAAADRGLRSVVITVDPARRLAQALGLDQLTNHPRPVAEFPSGGRLSALWLDPRSAFDDLVRKYAGSERGAERILSNRLFRIIQGQLGGIEEYLGVEKVLSLGQSGEFDICILDTPPSRHALDFLESPRHLIRFFDDTVLNTFIRAEEPEAAPTGLFRKIMRSGKAQAIETFKGFLGKTFLSEMSELLSNLKPVHRVFTETAEQIETWTRSPRCRIVGVSLYEPYPIDEIRLLGLELESRGLSKPHVLVLNKALPVKEPASMRDALRASLGEAAASGLIERHALQGRLRTKVSAQKLFSNAVAEVLRYSGRELDRDQLLKMGRIVFEAWEPRDPEFFSKT